MAEPTGALAFLPEIVFELAPALRPFQEAGESRATCDDCALLPRNLGGDESHPWAFNPAVRCCTFHPKLPNWAVGRALARGGVSAERVRERMKDRTGVGPVGVAESASHKRAEADAGVRSFGRDTGQRCPYWVGGELACGIWKDRNAICRSWFCRHDGGAAGRAAWVALEGVITWIERRLARICVEDGAPPAANADTEAFEAWYLWCAEHVESMSASDVERIRNEDLAFALDRWKQTLAAGDVPLPDVLVPVFAHAFVSADRLAVEGYTSYDGVLIDSSAIDVFERMNGARSWQDALLDSELTRADIDELYRISALADAGTVRARAERDGLRVTAAGGEPPDLLEPAMRKPVALGRRVWIQGEPSIGSVIVPSTVFELISRLDGETSWRDALGAVDDPAIDASVVARLYDIGALREPEPS